MKKVDIILTAATNLDGKVVTPSDEPVSVEKNLAAQLIANGRARLPELPKSESGEAGDQDQKVAEAEKAARERIAKAEKAAREAEDKALKQIEEYEEQVAQAEKDAHEQIEAHQKSVEEAANKASADPASSPDKKNQGA